MSSIECSVNFAKLPPDQVLVWTLKAIAHAATLCVFIAVAGSTICAMPVHVHALAKHGPIAQPSPFSHVPATSTRDALIIKRSIPVEYLRCHGNTTADFKGALTNLKY